MQYKTVYLNSNLLTTSWVNVPKSTSSSSTIFYKVREYILDFSSLKNENFFYINLNLKYAFEVNSFASTAGSGAKCVAYTQWRYLDEEGVEQLIWQLLEINARLVGIETISRQLPINNNTMKSLISREVLEHYDYKLPILWYMSNEYSGSYNTIAIRHNGQEFSYELKGNKNVVDDVL